MTRFEEYLDQQSVLRPNKIALIMGERSLTYYQWKEYADCFSKALNEKGIKRGERLVIYLENSLETAIAIFGAMKAGVIFSIVNSSVKSEKLAYIINNCQASAILTQDRLLKEADSAVSSIKCIKAKWNVNQNNENVSSWSKWEDIFHSRSDIGSYNPGLSIDLAMIIYTSGSTGQPKGVMMTHENIDAASWSITKYLENTHEDIILCTLPLSFDYGLYQILMACRIGATVVIEKSFTYPAEILEISRKHKVTGLPLVPTMAAVLVQMKEFNPDSYSHIRYITNTAAALPPAHILRLKSMFPRSKIYSMYGLTECKRCTYLPPDELDERPNSVGIAIPGTEAFVLNEHGEPVIPGEVGVLYIRGRTVMQGYWENQVETERMLKTGKYPWEKILCTHDLFKVDDDGYLYFVGRSDDIIKTRGEKVSPKEVENVLYAIPGVNEVAVVGIPDDILGNAIKAYIVISSGSSVTERDILKYCAQNLESYMVPKYIEFRQFLPKTNTGKIQRRNV